MTILKNCSGKNRRLRQLPQYSNPAYGGAFVYGRSRTTHHKLSSADKTTKKLPMEEWKVLIKDKYSAYIDWETFTKIQMMLKMQSTIAIKHVG